MQTTSIASTQVTPFVADTGRNPRMGFEPNVDVVDEDAEAFRDRMQEGLEEAKAALIKAQDEYARYYNRRRGPGSGLRAWDMVLLDASDIRTNRVSKKLDCIRLGPFEVEAAIGNGAYRLKLPESMRRLHPVFPVVKLFPLRRIPSLGRRQPAAPDPIIIDGENYYEVERILDSRCPGIVGSSTSSSGTDTTTRTTSGFPWYNLDAEDTIKEFHEQNP